MIAGFTIRPEVLKVMEKRAMTADEILNNSGYDPERIWKHASIAQARVALLGTWIGFFGGVSMVLSYLLLSLEAQKAAQGEDKWGSQPTPEGPANREQERKGEGTTGSEHPVGTERDRS